MEHWDLRTIDVEAHRPRVLHSDEEGRAIVLHLPAGEALQDHEVHERAWLTVLDGEIELHAGGETLRGGAGLLATWEPHERHEVRALQDARLLLLLSPWPGEGRELPQHAASGASGP